MSNIVQTRARRNKAARIIQRSWIRSKRRRVNAIVRRARTRRTGRRRRTNTRNNNQLATIGQVKRLIAKDQDPEYLKTAIGCEIENANIGSGSTAQINCFRLN